MIQISVLVLAHLAIFRSLRDCDGSSPSESGCLPRGVDGQMHRERRGCRFGAVWQLHQKESFGFFDAGIMLSMCVCTSSCLLLKFALAVISYSRRAILLKGYILIVVASRIPENIIRKYLENRKYENTNILVYDTEYSSVSLYYILESQTIDSINVKLLVLHLT